MKKTRHYHATNKEGLNAIFISRSIGVKYPDGFEGFFVTTDLEQAKNHGAYLIVIDDIKTDELVVDENTLDLMFKGIMPLTRALSIEYDGSDLRVQVDMINHLFDSVAENDDERGRPITVMDIQKVRLELGLLNPEPYTIVIPNSCFRLLGADC